MLVKEPATCSCFVSKEKTSISHSDVIAPEIYKIWKGLIKSFFMSAVVFSTYLYICLSIQSQVPSSTWNIHYMDHQVEMWLVT